MKIAASLKAGKKLQALACNGPASKLPSPRLLSAPVVSLPSASSSTPVLGMDSDSVLGVSITPSVVNSASSGHAGVSQPHIHTGCSPLCPTPSVEAEDLELQIHPSQLSALDIELLSSPPLNRPEGSSIPGRALPSVAPWRILSSVVKPPVTTRPSQVSDQVSCA